MPHHSNLPKWVFPVKHFRVLLPLLVFVLLLSGCAGEPVPYDYTSGGATAAVDPINHTISFDEKTFSFTVDVVRGISTTYSIHFPDGSEYHWTYNGTGGGITEWSENFDMERWNYAEFLMEALRQPWPREKTNDIILGILLITLGAAIYFLPVLGFYLIYGLVAEKAKLSSTQITMYRIGGVLVAVLGLIFCFI